MTGKIAYWAMDVQIKTEVLKTSDPTSALLFLLNLEIVCHNNNINEYPVIWLSPFFIWEPSMASLFYVVTAESKKSHQRQKI